MDEFTAIWVLNLQAMVSGVGDTFDSDHGFDVVHISTGDDRNVHVRVVRQSLKYVLGLWWQCCQIWVGCDRCQSTVVIQQ